MKRQFFIPLPILFAAYTSFAAFGYYSPLSINSAQVPSTQTDFPVLVSVTDARFKTVANSGHVQNASGFDIRPYTDGPPTTAITGYELERYNATTGEVVMWVKVSSLSSSTTPIYLAYGDAGISTDGSSTATWSNSFISVYHQKDGTTLSVVDSVGAHNGTNHGVTATTGQIDGGGGFVSASSQYIDTGNYGNTLATTVSCWIKATSFPNSYNAPLSKTGLNLFIKSTGKLAVYVTATGSVSYDGTGSHTLSTATWYYAAFTYNSTAGLIGYVNASSDGTAAANGVLGATGGITDIGQDPINAGRFWNGVIDELRISSIARSANWITTEYNNQNAPGTFETLGTEVSIGPVISPNRVNNFFFSE